MGIVGLMFIVSKRQGSAADAYAATTGGAPAALIAALKKLSVDNLSNLTPHPFKVFLSYSHPPVLDRIRRLALSPSMPYL